MAHITADRVQEVTTTTGTGNITLSGTSVGFRTFSAVMATNDTAFAAIIHRTEDEWEVSLVTHQSDGKLARTTVLASSNGGAAVNFSAGTKDIYLTEPAARLGRTLVGPNAGLSVTNGNGVSGNPTISLANDLAALEALGSTGFATRTGSDTWAQRVLVAPAAGLTITNTGGTSGNPTFALANDLAAVEGLSSSGIVVRTGNDAWAVRTITFGNGITVTNPSGSAGAPAFSLTGAVLNLHNNSTGVGDTALDLPRNADLGTAAFADIEAVKGIFPVLSSVNYQIVPQDFGKLILFTADSKTATLPLAADVQPGWWCAVRARGALAAIVARSGSDSVDGGTSVNIEAGQGDIFIRTSATTFDSI